MSQKGPSGTTQGSAKDTLICNYPKFPLLFFSRHNAPTKMRARSFLCNFSNNCAFTCTVMVDPRKKNDLQSKMKLHTKHAMTLVNIYMIVWIQQFYCSALDARTWILIDVQ